MSPKDSHGNDYEPMKIHCIHVTTWDIMVVHSYIWIDGENNKFSVAHIVAYCLNCRSLVTLVYVLFREILIVCKYDKDETLFLCFVSSMTSSKQVQGRFDFQSLTLKFVYFGLFVYL